MDEVDQRTKPDSAFMGQCQVVFDQPRKSCTTQGYEPLNDDLRGVTEGILDEKATVQKENDNAKMVI